MEPTKLEIRVAKLTLAYRANAKALAKALYEVVQEEVQAASRETERDIASRKCEHIHPAGSDLCACAGCFEALKVALGPKENSNDDL